jgi:hypothetical protein
MKIVHFASCAVLGLVVAGCSTTNSGLITRPQSNAWNTDAKVPAIVRAPEGHVLLGHVVGRGVETFTLQADPIHPDRMVWAAGHDEGSDLLDDDGNVVGHHEGNSWAMRDGGQVSADPIAQVPQRDRKPLALLQAVSHQGGGLMGGAEYVEQLHTVGGPPAAARGTLGTQFRAEYSADYYFYGAVASQTRRASMGG